MAIEVDWNKYAEQYDNITLSGANPAYLELVDFVSEYFFHHKIKSDSLIADIGGGTGNFTIPIAKMFPDSRFLIIDSSEVMLQKAKEKILKENLNNVDIIKENMVNLDSIVESYSRPFTHAMMMHSLYTVGGKDSDVPKKILKDTYNSLESKESAFIISDVNRQLRTANWIPYCLWNSYKSFRQESGILRSISDTIQFFKENDQSKLANLYIDEQQKAGNYIICSLDDFTELLQNAGFSDIRFKSDKLYRKRDNTAIAIK